MDRCVSCAQRMRMIPRTRMSLCLTVCLRLIAPSVVGPLALQLQLKTLKKICAVDLQPTSRHTTPQRRHVVEEFFLLCSQTVHGGHDSGNISSRTSLRASAAMGSDSDRRSWQERDTLPPEVPGPPSPHMPTWRSRTDSQSTGAENKASLGQVVSSGQSKEGQYAKTVSCSPCRVSLMTGMSMRPIQFLPHVTKGQLPKQRWINL